jgi:periplasmic divalent cation tolerance protein
MKPILITTTFDNKEEAEKVIDILLEERLVSCCQMSTITSKYHWKGNIEKSLEYQVKMKSKKELYSEIEKIILENHSYETPQIVYYEIDGGYKDYLDWINEETREPIRNI